MNGSHTITGEYIGPPIVYNMLPWFFVTVAKNGVLTEISLLHRDRSARLEYVTFGNGHNLIAYPTASNQQRYDVTSLIGYKNFRIYSLTEFIDDGNYEYTIHAIQVKAGSPEAGGHHMEIIATATTSYASDYMFSLRNTGSKIANIPVATEKIGDEWENYVFVPLREEVSLGATDQKLLCFRDDGNYFTHLWTIEHDERILGLTVKDKDCIFLETQGEYGTPDDGIRNSRIYKLTDLTSLTATPPVTYELTSSPSISYQVTSEYDASEEPFTRQHTDMTLSVRSNSTSADQVTFTQWFFTATDRGFCRTYFNPSSVSSEEYTTLPSGFYDFSWGLAFQRINHSGLNYVFVKDTGDDWGINTFTTKSHGHEIDKIQMPTIDRVNFYNTSSLLFDYDFYTEGSYFCMQGCSLLIGGEYECSDSSDVLYSWAGPNGFSASSLDTFVSSFAADSMTGYYILTVLDSIDTCYVDTLIDSMYVEVMEPEFFWKNIHDLPKVPSDSLTSDDKKINFTFSNDTLTLTSGDSSETLVEPLVITQQGLNIDYQNADSNGVIVLSEWEISDSSYIVVKHTNCRTSLIHPIGNNRSLDTLRGDVYFYGDLEVSANETLYVAANTNVYFSQEEDKSSSGLDTTKCEIIVKGHLKVLGTEDDTVKFMPNSSDTSREQWHGIVLDDGGTADINYAKIEKSKYAVYFDDDSCKLEMSNCLVGITLNPIYA